MEKRLDDQITWYSKKSSFQKNWFYTCRMISIILSASIPVLTGFVLQWHPMISIISVVGAASGVVEGFSTLTKLQEKWIEYRSIAETLKHEKFMYLASAGVYDDPDDHNKYKSLVERVESIISQENINWANMNDKKEKRK